MKCFTDNNNDNNDKTTKPKCICDDIPKACDCFTTDGVACECCPFHIMEPHIGRPHSYIRRDKPWNCPLVPEEGGWAELG